jgi:hypothetical protein
MSKSDNPRFEVKFKHNFLAIEYVLSACTSRDC